MSREIKNTVEQGADNEAAELQVQQQIAEELKATIEAMRLSDNPMAELDRLKRLDLSPVDLRAHLNAAFKVAVDSQAFVEIRANQGADEEELAELQIQADVVSKLVAHMGSENKAVEDTFSGKRKTVSAVDYKAAQVEFAMEFFQSRDPLHYDAVKRLAQVGYEFNSKPSFVKSVIDKPMIAKAAGAVALTAAISLVNNASPVAAAVEMTNATPTKPGDNDDEILSRKVVKINQSKVNPVIKNVDVTPVQNEQASKKTVIIKESTSKAVAPGQAESKKDAVRSPVVVRDTKQRTIEVNTLPLAEQKDKGGNVVRLIPPAPATPPATIQEAAPAAPAPEQQRGPYVLNAEQNGIIDSLNLSAAKKDFLRQVAAGAIGLQQRGAKVNPEVVIAQAALESGWGQSGLTKQANNYFGMKAGSDWKGKVISMPTEEANPDGSRYVVDATWPVFENAEDCFAEYAKFIERLPHFADALAHPNNPEAYVNALVNGNLKYATDPEYVQKIMGTIKANRLTELVSIAKSAPAPEVSVPKVETISQPKNELAPVTSLHLPVPEGSAISPQYPGHKGIDFAVKAGTPFYAAMGGTVEVRKFDVTNEQFCKDAFANLGRSVNEIKPEDRVQLEVRITRVIDGRKYVTVYAHMDRIDVEDGQIVEGGEQIGLTGNTGCSTGDHAHFEMQVDDMGSVAPGLLFDGEKWKAPGAIVPWSMDIKPQSADSDGSRSNEDGPHDTFCGCGNHTNLSSVKEANRSDQLAGEFGAQNPSEQDSYVRGDHDNRPAKTTSSDVGVAVPSNHEQDLDVVNQILARLNSQQTQEAAETGQILQSALQAAKK